MVNYKGNVNANEPYLLSNRFYSLALMILSLAVLWNIPASNAGPTLGNLVPRNFEVNAMAVSPQGDVAAGSFYAMDPTVIPWDLTNPIYKYVGVTLIVSNLDTSSLANSIGINIPTQLPTLLPFKIILIVQGVQTKAPAIASDIESIFGMPSGSFTALTSSPVTLPVSVFGADFTSSPYSSFVNKFVQGTSNKAVVIGQYSASLLENSKSGIVFNSVESLAYPVSQLFSAGSLNSAILGSEFNFAFSLNSTGVVVLQKNLLSFSQAQDHTLDFAATLGLTTPLKSTTNETFATLLPGGAQVKSFNPSTMIVQSSPTIALILGLFPWVGSAQRTLPDVSVTFHYPAFDGPVLSASWTTTPATFFVGQNFTLALTVSNTGAMNAQQLHFTLGYSLALSRDGPIVYGNSLQYAVASIPKGGADTHSFNFLAQAPEVEFTLSASYLDTSNFAYTWNTFFSVAPDVKTNGPLTVTKTLTTTNPAYGQLGNVTVSIHNTDTTAAYYNLVDITPEAVLQLYLNGPGGSSSSTGGDCPNVYNLQANTTMFTFAFQNGCGTTAVTQVYVGNQTNLYLVAQPNIGLMSDEQWTPLYRYPAGPSPKLGSPISVQLVLKNSQQISTSSYVYTTGSLPQLGDPKASYLDLYCSLCPVGKGDGAPTFFGNLVNATATPISGQPIQLSYSLNSNGTSRALATVTTDAQGRYSYSWTGAPQLPLGGYTLTAEFAGLAQNSPRFESIQVFVTEPTVIGPGKTVTMSYFYIFNATGTFTIEPERVIYSSRQNVSLIFPGQSISALLVGEFEAQSAPVTVTVSPPPVLPVVDTSLDTQKLSFLYVAQNQSLVRINLRVTNTGPQAATNVVVNSTIPGLYTPYSSYNTPYFLPVKDAGNVTVDKTRGVVTFSVNTLQPGQTVSAWYVVQANATSSSYLYLTASNVTAQAGASNFKFDYTGALLEIYPPLDYRTATFQGYLQTYVTMDPSVIAANSTSTATIHMYNTGNVTFTAVSGTVQSYSGLTFDRTSFTTPPILPGTEQTVTLTVTDHTSFVFNPNPSTGQGFSGTVSYTQTSPSTSSFSGNLLVYNSKVAGFNPSLRVTVSAPTTQVVAGAPAFVYMTATNTGTSNVTNVNFYTQANSPLFTAPETAYGSQSNNWQGSIGAGQSITLRLGILTRAGGQYYFSISYVNYQFNPPGSTQSTQYANIAGSTTAIIMATDTTGPAITIPWANPFAPTSSDQENVWTQASDGSGSGPVKLEYSADKTTWTTIAMTPLVGSYSMGQSLLQFQSTVGDIYSATIPAQSGGTTVYYRIRATDRLGNPSLQDNNGIDFSYTVQGGSNNAVVQQKPGTNVVVNLTQSIPTLRATITLNVSTPIAIQVTRLSSNPGGTPPAGTSPLGIYVQINANVSIILDARIRLYYTASQVQGLDPSTVTPYYWDGTNWVALGSVVVNTSQMWVEGTVHHFSLFAIFASASTTPPPPPPPPVAAQPPWLIIGVVAAVVTVGAIGGLYTTKIRKRGKPSTTPALAPPPTPGNPPSLGAESSSTI